MASLCWFNLGSRWVETVTVCANTLRLLHAGQAEASSRVGEGGGSREVGRAKWEERCQWKRVDSGFIATYMGGGLLSLSGCSRRNDLASAPSKPLVGSSAALVAGLGWLSWIPSPRFSSSAARSHHGLGGRGDGSRSSWANWVSCTAWASSNPAHLTDSARSVMRAS